jgi:hypothetical protein
VRELQFKKNQYGPLGESVVLRYQRGLLLPEAGTTDLEKLAREAKADEVFLWLLKAFAAQGRSVSEKPRAHAYAPRVFAQEPDSKKHRLRQIELEHAMVRLFKANKIRVEQYGRPSQPCFRLAINDLR